MNEWLGRQVETSGRIVIGRGAEVNESYERDRTGRTGARVPGEYGRAWHRGAEECRFKSTSFASDTEEKGLQEGLLIHVGNAQEKAARGRRRCHAARRFRRNPRGSPRRVGHGIFQER